MAHGDFCSQPAHLDSRSYSSAEKAVALEPLAWQATRASRKVGVGPAEEGYTNTYIRPRYRKMLQLCTMLRFVPNDVTQLASHHLGC